MTQALSPAAPANRLLDALSDEARAELLAIAQPVSFLRGAVLLRQGAPTRGAYFLHLGEAEASVQLPGGDALIVAQAGSGGVIGEMALLEHGLCSATVTAQSAVDGVFIGRDDFRVLVARRSGAALAIQQAVTLNLCAKLAALNAQILAHPTPEDAPWRAAEAGVTAIAAAGNGGRGQSCGFDYRRFLPRLPLFLGWDTEEIDALADLAGVVQVNSGTLLFGEGARADTLFVTVRGAVEIAAPVARDALHDAPTHLRRLAVLGPGHLIGHRSLVDGSVHAARARACENAVLLTLSRTRFLDLYRGNSPVALRLQAAVHDALLRAMAHTNVTLTRLVNLARLAAANSAALEAALAEQVLYAS